VQLEDISASLAGRSFIGVAETQQALEHCSVIDVLGTDAMLPGAFALLSTKLSKSGKEGKEMAARNYKVNQLLQSLWMDARAVMMWAAEIRQGKTDQTLDQWSEAAEDTFDSLKWSRCAIDWMPR
jgi:hypothetical protein